MLKKVLPVALATLLASASVTAVAQTGTDKSPGGDPTSPPNPPKGSVGKPHTEHSHYHHKSKSAMAASDADTGGAASQ
jgi:hypothetical protein